MIRRPTILLILISLVGQLGAAIPQRVLFVGNSYTHYENMTQVVAAFAASRDFSMETRKSTDQVISMLSCFRNRVCVPFKIRAK